MNIKNYRTIFVFPLLTVFFLFFFLTPSSVSATTLYWVGGNGDSATLNANDWNTTNPSACNDGGGNASAVPGSADVATFDPDCDNNSAISSNWTVQKIDLQSGYTGTVTQNTTVTITLDPGSSGDSLVVAGGTFTGGDAAIDINDGNFNQSGGTFTNSSGNMTIERGFTLSGGTFTNTNTTVTFDDSSGADDTTVTCTGTLGGTMVVTKNSDADFINASGCTISFGANPTTTIDSTATNPFDNNGTVTIASGTWTVTGSGTPTINNDGTITHSGNGWDFNDSDLTNNAGATITYSGTAITMERSFTQSGTFDLTGITVTFDGGNSSGDNPTVTCSGSLGGTVVFSATSSNVITVTIASGCSISLGASPTTNTNTGTITNNGTITVTSGTWTSTSPVVNSGTITHSGTGWDFNDAALTNNSGATITYSGTSLTIERNFTQNGTFDLTGITVTLDGTADADDSTLTCGSTLAGNLTINKTHATGNTTLGGNCTIAGNLTRTDGPVTNPASAYTLTVQGNFSMSTTDTFGGTNMTFAMGGSGTQTITQNAGSIAGSFTVDKSAGTASIASGLNLSAGSTCNVVEGTFGINGRTFTCTSTFTVENGGILQLFGTSGESLTTPTLNSGSGVTYTGDGDSAADTITITTLATTYYDLTINSTDGTTDTFQLGADLDVNETLTLTAGTFSVSGSNYNIAVGGGWTDTGAGTFTEGTGTVTFDGTGTINSNETFNNVSINTASTTLTVSTNTLQAGGTLAVSAGTLDMNGVAGTITGATTISGGTYSASTATQTFNSTLTISGGTFTGSSGTVDANNTLTISSGTFTAPSSSGTLSVSGNFAFTGGTFTHNSGTLTFDASSGTQTLNAGGASINNVSHSGAGTLQLTSNGITIGGTLTNSAGTYDANALATTVTGLATISGGTYTASTATQTFDGGLTVSGGTFTGSSGTIDVNGALVVSSETFTAPSSSGTLTISGNFTHSGGTFTHNSGTVTLDGSDQTLSGSTTFYNLTKTVSTARTLTFPASSTQTIAGTVTLKGASGALLSLRSSTTDTQWSFNPQGTRSIEYLDVKDSYNTNSTAITTATFNITDSGNNTGWTFNTDPNVPSSLGSSSLTNGSWTTNTTPTLSFTLSDPDSGQTVLFRIQIDDTSDFSSLVVDYTSALQAQGATSFTVGQSAGSGSYSTGSSGQTLSDSSGYYWRVRTQDANGVTSSYATANSGSAAFKVDGTAPASFTLSSPDDLSYIKDERPTFKFKLASTPDATSGIEKYTLAVDNGDNGDFTIDDIPPSRTSDYTTNKFVIHYEGFGDGEGSNDYISLYTKSSASWNSGEYDGKLKEGKRIWTVTAYDNAGNSKSGSYTLYADFTAPELTSSIILPDEIEEIDSYHLLTTTIPHIKSTITDNLFPYQVEVSFIKENFFLGFKTGERVFIVEKITINSTARTSPIAFNIQPSRNIEYGKYRVEVTALDKAGNISNPQEVAIHILTDQALKTLLTLKGKKDAKRDIKQKAQSTTSFPYLEKKAKIRREKESEELQQTISQLQQWLSSLASLSFADLTRIVKPVLFGSIGSRDNNHEQVMRFIPYIQHTLIALTKLESTMENILAYRVYEFEKYIDQTIHMVGPRTKNATLIADQTVKNIRLSVDENIVAPVRFLLASARSLLNEAVETLAYVSPKAVRHTTNTFVIKPINGIFTMVKTTTAVLTQRQHDSMNETRRHTKEQMSVVSQFITSTGEQTQQALRLGGQALRIGGQAILQQTQRVFIGVQSIGKTSQKVFTIGQRVIKAGEIGFITFYEHAFDNAPTTISNILVEEIGRDYFIVSWKTNHHTINNKVNYGQTLTYGNEVWGENYTKTHMIKLTNLKPNTHYLFEVMSQGKNYVYDAYYGVTTRK